MAAVAVAGAASAETTAAVAARAAKVFLLRLPRGRPRLRDTGGVAVGPLALFLVPSGRPRLRPLDPPGPPAPGPPGAPVDDMAESKASWRGKEAILRGRRRRGGVGRNPSRAPRL
jgi:hypothetical protein